MSHIHDSLQSSLRVAAFVPLFAAAFAGCDDGHRTGESHISDEGPDRETRIQSLFDSLLDGVQLVEGAEDVAKQSGATDPTTDPPSYIVSYEGCVDGYVAGQLCVRDGRHLMHVLAPELHLIRSVDQAYVLDGFGSVPDYRMTGSLKSHVEVTIDSEAQTTQVEGTATGTLEVGGQLEGPVEVSLSVAGGRNYTESEATPIIVTGTLTHEGVVHQVEGGFQRE